MVQIKSRFSSPQNIFFFFPFSQIINKKRHVSFPHPPKRVFSFPRLPLFFHFSFSKMHPSGLFAFIIEEETMASTPSVKIRVFFHLLTSISPSQKLQSLIHANLEHHPQSNDPIR